LQVHCSAPKATREKVLDILTKGPAACSKAVLVTNSETDETVEYVSQREAARQLKVALSSIQRCIKSGKALKGI
jgi:hypothetical protein